MTGYQICKMYLALRMHFDPGKKYDFFKYNGSTRYDESKFETRKDRWHFERIAQHENPRMLMVTACSMHPDHGKWIGDVHSSAVKDEYNRLRGDIDQLRYWFKGITNELLENRDAFLGIEHGQPGLARRFFAREVPMHQLAILNKVVLSFVGYWEENSKYDPLLATLCHRIKAYTPFLDESVDWSTLRPIAKELIEAAETD